MSKYVKNLMTEVFKERLSGVNEILLVDVIGMENNHNVALRKELRSKGLHLMVVKNSLAGRATEGTALAPAFDGLTGSSAILWGGEDVVSMAKEISRLSKVEEYAPFAPKGGVMEGRALSAADVVEVSKWPSREEQLSILSGQLLSVGATLSSQLLGPGRQLASQIKQKGEEGGE